MPERYSVSLAKDYFVFSAAHFITFNGNVCERLHGHNYKVAADLEAELDENHYVVDFIALRDELKVLVDRLDHRMLLPLQHPTINVVPEADSVEVTFEDRRWVFPKDDCVLLPLANTTTELLAKHIGLALIDRLAARGVTHIVSLTVSVDENEGQWGRWHFAM